MTLQEPYELVKKAVDNHQLKDLFLGAPGYEWNNLKHIPANVATDISAILEQGLYILYENGDDSIPQKLETVVFEFLEGTPVEIWTAYSICWSQCWNEQKRKSPFQFICQETLLRLKNAIFINKEKLIACHELVGVDKKEGLWEDLVISNQNLKKRFGVEIL